MTGDAHPLPPLDQADSETVHALRPSPNHGERRPGATPAVIVLHYTGMADGPAAIDWLCDPRSQVSCHYVVEEDGRVLQLVAEARRAWHAGRSSWAGETDLNSVSIGIEIVNPGHSGGLPPYPAPQITAVIDLCRDIAARHAIEPARVLAHSDIAPGRKEDPGEKFPWARLHDAGLGLWLPPRPDPGGSTYRREDAGVGVWTLQRQLAAFGYGIEATGFFDAATETVVRAFQLHFRQARVDGVADPETVLLLHDLLALRGPGPAGPAVGGDA